MAQHPRATRRRTLEEHDPGMQLLESSEHHLDQAEHALALQPTTLETLASARSGIDQANLALHQLLDDDTITRLVYPWLAADRRRLTLETAWQQLLRSDDGRNAILRNLHQRTGGHENDLIATERTTLWTFHTVAGNTMPLPGLPSAARVLLDAFSVADGRHGLHETAWLVYTPGWVLAAECLQLLGTALLIQRPQGWIVDRQVADTAAALWSVDEADSPMTHLGSLVPVAEAIVHGA